MIEKEKSKFIIPQINITPDIRMVIIIFLFLSSLIFILVNFNIYFQIETAKNKPAIANNQNNQDNSLYKCVTEKSNVTGQDVLKCTNIKYPGTSFITDEEGYEPVNARGNCTRNECLVNSQYYGPEGFVTLTGYYTEYNYSEDAIQDALNYSEEAGSDYVFNKNDFICDSFIAKSGSDFIMKYLSNKENYDHETQFGTFENTDGSQPVTKIGLGKELTSQEKTLLFNSTEDNPIEVDILMTTIPQRDVGLCYSQAKIISVRPASE